MSKDLIALIVGVLISVALEIVPGLRDVWSTWKWKPLTLLVAFVGVPVVLWLLHCYGGIDLVVTDCTTKGLIQVIILGFTAFGGNQATFKLGANRLPNAALRNSG